MPDLRRTQPDLVLAGRYRLEHLIARGGMAEVWRADDSVLGRAVAVKVLLPHLAADESFMARFRREAISAARLSHPKIVATYDTGVDDGLAYIVMELVDGQTLRDTLASPSRLPPARVVEIVADVAEALQHAHRSGLVHRDVKPANILLCPDGRIKVADFGIAKAALGEDGFDQDLTQTGAILGTAKYLSPEQVDGRPSDGRSDVYALGVVLYEMLCGRPPFSGDTDMALGAQHLSSRPPRPRGLCPELPVSLEAIVLKALAKSPEERFASAGAMGATLKSASLEPAEPSVAETDDVTPPQGLALSGASTRARRRSGSPSPGPSRSPERSWTTVVVIAAVLVVVALVTAIALLPSDENGSPGDGSSPGGTGGTPLRIAEVTSFDPGGNGSEHDGELANLTDGDPSTTWGTEQYASARFGNLKQGVGVILRLDRASALERLRVVSPSRGWTAEVVAADDAASDRPGWGQALDRATASAGETTFGLKGRTATHVLLWITDLGPGQASIEIGEITAA